MQLKKKSDNNELLKEEKIEKKVQVNPQANSISKNKILEEKSQVKQSENKSSVDKKKKKIILVTGNKNKLIEFQMILKDIVDLTTEDCDLPELQGEPEEIAKQKALIAFSKLKQPIIVEDTSLCFNAYQGLPGPYIKWFLQKLKPQGLYKMLTGFEDKTGYAQCIISYMSEELKEPLLFVGRTHGQIVQPRQKEGPAFGWDPIFQPDNKKLTYAEMEKSEKNQISHRYKAIVEMLKYFEKN